MARAALSFVVLTIMMLGLKRSEGATYTVGESTGWLNPTNPDFYDNWADGKTFFVGDVLTFRWVGSHTVAKVSEAQYDACTTTVPNIMTTSPTSYTLNTTGSHHFICTVSNHCMMGQKVDIDVLPATATSPPTTTTPATSPPTTTTPATSPPTTTTPAMSPPTTTTGSTPANSAGSFGPIAAISAILSVVVFAFMC